MDIKWLHWLNLTMKNLKLLWIDLRCYNFYPCVVLLIKQRCSKFCTIYFNYYLLPWKVGEHIITLVCVCVCLQHISWNIGQILLELEVIIKQASAEYHLEPTQLKMAVTANRLWKQLNSFTSVDVTYSIPILHLVW